MIVLDPLPAASAHARLLARERLAALSPPVPKEVLDGLGIA